MHVAHHSWAFAAAAASSFAICVPESVCVCCASVYFIRILVPSEFKRFVTRPYVSSEHRLR